MSALVLRDLTPADEAAFLAGWNLFVGESPHWYSFSWRPGTPYHEHLELLRKEKAGEDLAPGRVPHSMLYGFVDGAIVGRVSIRHTLNEQLRWRGGHLGYAVAPAHRRKGYACEMFRQALGQCRAVGLDRIMITCDNENQASWKLLENHGAVMEEKFYDIEDKAFARRYWLDL